MRASCQDARILIRLEETWEERRQTLTGLRTMRGVGRLCSRPACLSPPRRSQAHNAEDTDKAGEPSESGERHAVWRERGNTSHPPGGALRRMIEDPGKCYSAKRLIYGTGLSARHDSPTSIWFFFCAVSSTAPALPGQSLPSITGFFFFLSAANSSINRG